MNLLFKLATWIACDYFSISDIYAQKNVPGEPRYEQYLAFQHINVASESKMNNSSKLPVVKFTMDETFNISVDNENAKQPFKTAMLNFSSQNLMSSKIIADPINPASPLLHDDSHVLALCIHARKTFPLLLKFAFYL